MIITVTLNAAMDRTLVVPNVRLGRRHRSIDQQTFAGGKGVNVARAIKRLGRPVIATGFAGGATGTRIVEALTEESILNDFVRIRDESRTNTAVLDPTTGVQTEINEKGPSVTEAELQLFTDKLLYLAQGANICVFAGSLPRGVPAEVYANLVRELRRIGVTTVVDTDGEAMHLAVRAEPDVVTPNAGESEELAGHEFTSDEDRALALGEIAELGAREAIMTVGDGCFARLEVDGAPRIYRVRVEEQEARAAIGSGDAFVAGYVAARYSGSSPEECLTLAVACGADSVNHLGAGRIEPSGVDRMRSEVQLERLELPAVA
jgi:1-phosphofructokinase family hexose kinase